MKPNNITCGSPKKVWWLGKCGREWQTKVCYRTRGHGCIYCTNQKVLSGFNDLKTKNYKLANEWNYEKNIGLVPEMFLPNSKKKVYWICENKHQWEAEISSRSQGAGCPYCSGRKAIKGVNDIASKGYPWLQEWDYEKNDVSPIGGVS